MPLKTCSVNGKSGWKWGDSGHCYPGKAGKIKAIKQGVAIEGPANFKKMMAKAGLEVFEMQRIMRDLDCPTGWDKLVAFYEEEGYQRLVSYITHEQRQNIPLSDFGSPSNRTFPITSQEHVQAAASLLHHAPLSKQAAIKKRIIAIAKRKGFSLPTTWTDEKSKASENEWENLVAYMTAEERNAIPLQDFADPESKSFPINSQEHVIAAAKLLHHAPMHKQATIKHRIMEIAHRKGFKLPAAWEKENSK